MYSYYVLFSDETIADLKRMHMANRGHKLLTQAIRDADTQCEIFKKKIKIIRIEDNIIKEVINYIPIDTSNVRMIGKDIYKYLVTYENGITQQFEMIDELETIGIDVGRCYARISASLLKRMA